MTRLTAPLRRIGALLDVLAAAFSAAAATRINHRPAAADLTRLGIAPKNFTVRL